MSSALPDAEAIADALLRLSRLMRSAQHGNGLNPAQWEALRYLARANRYSRSPKALAAFLGATKGTVSQTLLALHRKGLVERRPDPNDGRGLRLRLTRAGEAALRADPVAAVAAAAGRLTATHKAACRRGLAALLAEAQRRNGRTAFGVCATCAYFRRGCAAGARGGPHRCGLTGEPLSAAESAQICAEHVVPA
jgi:DNA-binding MarR family transcriptional regulator